MPKCLVLHLFVYTTKLTVFKGTEMDIGTSKLMSSSLHFVSGLTAFKMADSRRRLYLASKIIWLSSEIFEKLKGILETLEIL